MRKTTTYGLDRKYAIAVTLIGVLIFIIGFLCYTENHYSSAINNIRNEDLKQALEELDRVPEWYREQSKIHQYIKLASEYADEDRDQYRETADKTGELSFSNEVMESIRKNLYNEVSSAADQYDADVKTANEFDEQAKIIADGDLQKITLENKSDIVALYQQYNYFDSDVLELITQGNFVIQANERISDIEAANEVIAKINEIGEVTLEKKDSITEVRTSYSALTSYAQGLVTNLSVLDTAEKQVEDMESAQLVVDEIDEIGIISLDDETTINNIQKKYDGLSNESKKYVTNYSKLQQAQNKITSLKQKSIDDDTKEITGYGHYWWVTNSKVYHIVGACNYINQSKHITYGNSPPSGRRLCKSCAA